MIQLVDHETSFSTTHIDPQVFGALQYADLVDRIVRSPDILATLKRYEVIRIGRASNSTNWSSPRMSCRVMQVLI